MTAYLWISICEIVPIFHEKHNYIAAEQQNWNAEQISNTVEFSLYATLENGVHVAITTTFIQDSIQWKEFLTVLITALMYNNSTILPTIYFILKHDGSSTKR